jgi:hypothetical protein
MLLFDGDGYDMNGFDRNGISEDAVCFSQIHKVFNLESDDLKWAFTERVIVEDIKCVMNGYFWREETAKIAPDHLLLWSEILTWLALSRTCDRYNRLWC